MKPNRFDIITAKIAARTLGPSDELTVRGIISYAESLGYKLTEEDADHIIATSYPTETVEEAVNDYLDAFER